MLLSERKNKLYTIKHINSKLTLFREMINFPFYIVKRKKSQHFVIFKLSKIDKYKYS